MPALANIVVKKDDGTTDVTYTGTAPASGANPATFFAPALGATAETRPEFRITSKAIGQKGLRKVVGTLMYPFHTLNSTTGQTTVVTREIMRVESPFDPSVPTTTMNEAISQAMNLFASSLFKASAKEGNAPS